jgi:hypothetical protein
VIVKPANPAHVIRDPRTKRPLPAKGANVPRTTFWHRRLMCGDVVLAESSPSSSSTSKKSSSKSKE